MSVSSALNAARSGLQTTSLRAEIVAQNVAHASTPGYVRRSVDISETILAGKTTGVRPNGISRADNPALTAERRLSASDLAQQGTLASAWESIASRVGSSLENAPLFNAISTFDSALVSAAATPESSTQAAALFSASKSVVSELNSLSSMTVSMRGETDRGIQDAVNSVNQALVRVQDLNVRLMSVNRTTTEAAALFDERARVLDTIAEYLPVRTVERQGGSIDVLTEQGVYLVAGSARQIAFSPSLAFTPDRTLANGALSGLSVDGIDLTPGAVTYGGVSSGKISALFQLRDQDLSAFSQQLDLIANDFITRFSDDTIDPTKALGAPGLFVDTNSVAGVGVASRLALNAAIDPAQGGAIWRLRDGIGAAMPGPEGNSAILSRLSDALRSVDSVNGAGIQGRFSAPELAAHFTSLVGQSRLGHDSVLASSRTQHSLLTAVERSETGVDIDAQMQELLLIEQAYAANARVIEIAGQLINRLMEI